MSTTEPHPIFASELRDALAFCLAICPTPEKRPSLSFVAIVPEPDRHRFLVTARNGNAWVGAYVDGDGMQRIALSHECAKRTLKRLAAECSIQESPRVQPDTLSRKTWYVAASDENDPVVAHLEEHVPRWDVRSRVAPASFPSGWEAPSVQIRGAFAASPVGYPSDVFVLGKFWRDMRAMWWVDALTGFCRVEFLRGDRLAAFAIVVPWGHRAGEKETDPRQTEIPGAETAPPAERKRRSPKTEAPAANNDATEAAAKPSSDPPPADAGPGANTSITEPAADDTEPKVEDVPIPSDLSAALVVALRLAKAFRLATERHEMATYTGKNRDGATTESEAASAAFWGAFEALTETDKSLCTQIASDAASLARALESHPEPGAKKRRKKGDNGQAALAE